MFEAHSDLFTALEQLLTSLPSPHGNPCGTCNACCRADLSHHRVSSLELEWIAQRESRPVSERFRAYLERQRNAQGELRFPICPNYQDGCQIYSVRPFSCRTFGRFREQGTKLPDGCVFVGSEVIYAARDYFQALPQSRPLRALTREFELFLRSPQSHYESTQGPGTTAEAAEFFQHGDELDRALALQAQGRLEEALEQVLSAPEGNYREYSLALLYSIQDNHLEAAQHFSALARRIPSRAEFHYYAGYHMLFMGRVAEAVAALHQAVQAEPDHSMSWGLLGYLDFQKGRWMEAAEYFRQARQADPSNPFFALRWACCQVEMEQNAPGLSEAFKQAARSPATAGAATQYRSRAIRCCPDLAPESC
jgi:tetratricopeptide (TPR) repeat protein